MFGPRAEELTSAVARRARDEVPLMVTFENARPSVTPRAGSPSHDVSSRGKQPVLAGCRQVMDLIAGVRGAMARLMAEVVEDRVRTQPCGYREASRRAERRGGRAAARSRPHLPEVRG